MMTMQFVENPWFYALAIPALILNGISKGGLGGGIGSVSVPMMALAVPPSQAAAIMLPILCVMDLPAIHAYFGRWDKVQMRTIIPAGLLGLVVGTITFRYLNDNWIRVLLGVIAIGFVLNSMRKQNPGAAPPTRAKGWFWCSISGYTSFVAHSGGPPLTVYLLPQKLDKTVFVATSVIFFAVGNYLKIGPYMWLGLFDTRNLATSAVLFPAGVIGVYLGVWLHKRISQTLFYRIVYVLLLASGAKLLYDGVTRLW
jgi:uncharacterized membrane protein YfcA